MSSTRVTIHDIETPAERRRSQPRVYTGQGPHSRLLARGVVDGRSEYGRFLATARFELIEHLGGVDSLNVFHKVLVDRATWLMLHVALFDQKMTETGEPLNERDRCSYCAYVNTLMRALRQLGLSERPISSATINEIMRDIDRDAA